jgi:hypothetical protein
MPNDDVARQIADALIEQHGTTAAIAIAEMLASMTGGNGVEFWQRVIDVIRARIRA